MMVPKTHLWPCVLSHPSIADLNARSRFRRIRLQHKVFGSKAEGVNAKVATRFIARLSRLLPQPRDL